MPSKDNLQALVDFDVPSLDENDFRYLLNPERVRKIFDLLRDAKSDLRTAAKIARKYGVTLTLGEVRSLASAYKKLSKALKSPEERPKGDESIIRYSEDEKESTVYVPVDTLVTNPKTCVIDASTAHRTAAGWVFGVPELAPDQRQRIRNAKRISNPGCHSTGFILLLRPLVDAGLVPAELPLAGTSITGYSGGGKKMIEQYEAGADDPRLAAPRPYGLNLAHKHIPEMAAHTGLRVKPVFQPIVGNFYKGLAVSVPLHLAQLRAGTRPEDVHAALAQRYSGERFIRVMPLRDPATFEADAGYFDVQACHGTNRVDIFVFANDTQAMLMARLDNLGKGASGAAVQTMNVHLGLDEGLGL